MSSSQAASQVNRVSLILRCGFWVHKWNTYDICIHVDLYIYYTNVYMEIIIVLYELLMHLKRGRGELLRELYDPQRLKVNQM